MSKRDEIIGSIDSIPAIPVSATKAIRLLQNPEKDLNEVIRTIEYSPAITVNILKLVNSMMFAATQKICSLREAVVRLGANNILQILIGSSMASTMKRSVTGYDLPSGELWKSAVFTGVYTDILKKSLKLDLPDYAFTAGLLRDIGKIVMGLYVDVNGKDIKSFADTNRVTFTQAEQDILGIDHAEVGAILLQKWSLPEELTLPVRWHHTPELEGESNVVTEVVHIADALTMMEGVGAGCEGLSYRFSDTVATKLGMTMELMEMIVCRAQIKRDEIEELFEI